MGPCSIQGELMSGNCRAASLGNPRLSGGHVFVSHVLSGKHRLYEPSEGIFDGVVPGQDFSMADGTWGAFQVALPLSTLDLDSQGLAGGRQRDLRAGLNWNLNPSTRLMFNHVRVLVTSRGTVPALDRGRADLWQARMPRLGFLTRSLTLPSDTPSQVCVAQRLFGPTPEGRVSMGFALVRPTGEPAAEA